MADEDLSDLFGEYGMVESINLIPPRGCAFVHMNRRMDAYKALKELHKHKLHGKPITVCPGKLFWILHRVESARQTNFKVSILAVVIRP